MKYTHKSNNLRPVRKASHTGHWPQTGLLTLAVLILLGVPQWLLGQETGALPQQKRAIRSLAGQQGFSAEQLQQYLLDHDLVSVDALTRNEAAELIRMFQSGSPAAPPAPAPLASQRQAVVRKSALPPVSKSPILATILEVGMEKRFHLVDGNVIAGKIIRIEDGVCSIETIDGLLNVPASVILEETAQILKRDDTRFVGAVLRDSEEEIVLRSSYGDVVISKRDIKDMDRYYGGRRVPWAEEKRRFFQGEEVLTDVMMDPTAFPLTANTFYLSGLSIGYGFTDRFMVRSLFGNDLLGDLNLHPILQIYHRRTGATEVAVALGAHLYNHHPMRSVASKYANHIVAQGDQDRRLSDTGLAIEQVMPDVKSLYWEAYVVMSSRRSLATGRGKLGWHIGLRTNSLILSKPALAADSGFVWDKSFIPYRAWGAFEYDLSKRLKLLMEIWADNGHRFQTFSTAAQDYFADDTPFVFDAPGGDYRPVDFDFGLLYALKDNFRIGIHFQQPYLLFYWEFRDL